MDGAGRVARFEIQAAGVANGGAVRGPSPEGRARGATV